MNCYCGRVAFDQVDLSHIDLTNDVGAPTTGYMCKRHTRMTAATQLDEISVRDAYLRIFLEWRESVEDCRQELDRWVIPRGFTDSRFPGEATRIAPAIRSSNAWDDWYRDVTTNVTYYYPTTSTSSAVRWR